MLLFIILTLGVTATVVATSIYKDWEAHTAAIRHAGERVRRWEYLRYFKKKGKKKEKSFGVLFGAIVIMASLHCPNGWLGTPWLILSVGLSVLSLTPMFDFSGKYGDIGDAIEVKLWGPDVPSPPMPPVRKAQFVLLGLLLIVSGVFAGYRFLTGGTAVPSAAPTGPTASAAPAACVMPSLTPVSSPHPSSFSPVGVKEYVNGKWIDWTGPAPAQVTVTAAGGQDASYAYYQFRYGNKAHTICVPSPSR